MKTILYVLAVLLLTTWLVGVVIYAMGALFHLLLISAVLLIIALSRIDKNITTGV